MKQESLVIADQHAAVNTFSSLVHTARHTMEVGFILSYADVAKIRLMTEVKS